MDRRALAAQVVDAFISLSIKIIDIRGGGGGGRPGPQYYHYYQIIANARGGGGDGRGPAIWGRQKGPHIIIITIITQYVRGRGGPEPAVLFFFF